MPVPSHPHPPFQKPADSPGHSLTDMPEHEQKMVNKNVDEVNNSVSH